MRPLVPLIAAAGTGDDEATVDEVTVDGRPHVPCVGASGHHVHLFADIKQGCEGVTREHKPVGVVEGIFHLGTRFDIADAHAPIAGDLVGIGGDAAARHARRIAHQRQHWLDGRGGVEGEFKLGGDGLVARHIALLDAHLLDAIAAAADVGTGHHKGRAAAVLPCTFTDLVLPGAARFQSLDLDGAILGDRRCRAAGLVEQAQDQRRACTVHGEDQFGGGAFVTGFIDLDHADLTFTVRAGSGIEGVGVTAGLVGAGTDPVFPACAGFQAAHADIAIACLAVVVEVARVVDQGQRRRSGWQGVHGHVLAPLGEVAGHIGHAHRDIVDS